MRIFIDCSFVDFSRQPTGIPRVVLKYVEAGYEWGEQHGVDVVPVVTTEKGLLPVRPLPGESPPPSAERYVRPTLEHSVSGAAAVGHLREAETAIKAALIQAGAPTAVDRVEAGVSRLFSNLVSGEDDLAELKINVGPGDMIFYPAYWHDLKPKWLTNLSSKGASIFILVHDILPISFAKFYNSPWRDHFADNLLAATRNADQVLAVSRYSADGVLNFAHENGVELSQVDVLHNGFDPLVEDPDIKRQIDDGSYRPAFAGREKFDFFVHNRPYLMVGTIEPKKGHIPVIQSFERLWRMGLERKLALVGRRGWLDEEVVRYIENSPFYKERLFWFDDIDDEGLYVAYRNSRALIFGSYAEGFGIPIIEAQTSQLPVICYDTEVAREVSGAHALFYSDFETFAKHVSDMEEDRFRDLKRNELRDFSWPSWHDIAFRLFDYLESRARTGEGERDAVGNHR